MGRLTVEDACAPGGFTIVETIVALAIITSGALAMTALALQTTDLVGRARRHAIGSLLADGGLAELMGRTVSPTSPTCLTSDVAGCVALIDAQGRPVAGPAAPFSLRWHVAPLTSGPAPASVLTVCAVPAAERAPTARLPRACTTRVVMEPWP